MSATPIPENRNLRLLPLLPPARRCPALLHVRSRAIKIPRKRIPACPRSLSTRRTFYGTSTVRRAAGIDSQIYMPVALGRVEPRCVLLLFGRWAGGGSLTIGWVRTPRVQRGTLFVGCSGPRDYDLERCWFCLVKEKLLYCLVSLKKLKNRFMFKRILDIRCG